MANLITSCRILCSILMLFFPALSPTFYALYLSAGITDILDGTVARKTNTVTDFGSKLDKVILLGRGERKIKWRQVGNIM